ncbi:hypothetical protein Mth01_20770 [Sphaerimonospora thailandensis]|uniref:Uncharacterized protein n=1 Tax=Sphaerimonospora thailandensis TaxID=795644 RepID=A0A8J3R854_9ACTN|nr:hypothetical protein Mth01_20770 [Sphaerimonospora thailandensis]
MFKGAAWAGAGGARGIKARRSDHIEREIFTWRTVSRAPGGGHRLSLPFVSGRLLSFPAVEAWRW